MRKMMTKEVTKTTVKVAKIENVNGEAEKVDLPDEILLGNVTLEKAQNALNKKHDEHVTVFEVQSNTEIYEMPVEKFIELADVKEKETEQA